MNYTVHVEANNPPGKRCTLYLRYAEKIGQHLCLPFSANYHASHPTQGRIAPSLLVAGAALAPQNGDVLLPTDVHAALPDASMELLETLIEVHRVKMTD
jgi:cystathionine gamma-synthase